MFGDKFDGANGDAKGVDTLIEGVDVFAWGLTHKWVRLMHDGVARGGKSLRLNACFNFTNFKRQNLKYSHISPFGIWLSRIRKSANALCSSIMDAIFNVTTTISMVAFACYLFTHSFIFVASLFLLHDNHKCHFKVKAIITPLATSKFLETNSLSLFTSIVGKGLGLVMGVIF